MILLKNHTKFHKKKIKYYQMILSRKQIICMDWNESEQNKKENCLIFDQFKRKFKILNLCQKTSRQRKPNLIKKLVDFKFKYEILKVIRQVLILNFEKQTLDMKLYFNKSNQRKKTVTYQNKYNEPNKNLRKRFTHKFRQ